MQNDEIVDELHIATSKFHFDRHARASTDGIEIVYCFNFFITQLHAFMHHPFNRITVIATMQQPFVEAEDRNTRR